jgi:pimeloyl-ACP methyl ester carboxylesterase
MTRRSRAVGALALAGLVLALGVIARFGPALAVSAALAAPRVEGWLEWVSGAPVRAPVSLRVEGRRLEADLYRPATRTPRGAIVLVHGLSRAGRRHPELIRLARLLAREGELVLVPQLDGLAAFRLSGREVEDIRAGARYLAGVTRGPVAVAGFSFGAGPALLAAADLPGVRVAGSFGGYAELRHVIAYITTGVFTFRGQRYQRRQEEYNRWKLLALLVGFVASARDRAVLAAVADRKLADPSAATEDRERGLEGEGRAVMALVRNRREEMVDALIGRLSPAARAALARLSPLAAVPRLSGRLLVAHGADDDSIPYTESLRLAEAARGRARVAILRSFHHTGPEPFWPATGRRAIDAWHLLRLVDALLRAEAD